MYLSEALSAIERKPQQEIQHHERSATPLPSGLNSQISTSTSHLTGFTSLTSLSPHNLSGIGTVTETAEHLRINPTRSQPNPESDMPISTRATKPRLYVAVEFGITDTAVAFAYLRDKNSVPSRPEMIRWPGLIRPERLFGFPFPVIKFLPLIVYKASLRTLLRCKAQRGWIGIRS